MSLDGLNCGVQHQEMVIKTEAVEAEEFDDTLLLTYPKVKCENGQKQKESNDSSCDQSCKLNNLENTSSFLPVKNEPEDLRGDRQVKTEHVKVKEEDIDLEEHKIGWELTRRNRSSNVGVFINELNGCDSSLNTFIYKCNECAFESASKFYFSRHYKRQHSKDVTVYNYKCQECSYETRCKGNLTRHYKAKHSEDAEVYKCRECLFKTRYKSNVTKHYKEKHAKDAELYKCQECSYQTKRKLDFTEHYKCKHRKGDEGNVLLCFWNMTR